MDFAPHPGLGPTCVAQECECFFFLLVRRRLRKPNLSNNSQLKEDTEGGAAKEGETIRRIVLCRHTVRPVLTGSREGNNRTKKKKKGGA